MLKSSVKELREKLPAIAPVAKDNPKCAGLVGQKRVRHGVFSSWVEEFQHITLAGGGEYAWVKVADVPREKGFWENLGF